MNNPKRNEVIEKRQKVLLKIIEMFDKQDDNDYTGFDFIVDRLLRETLGLPKKEVGKAPYDFIEL